MKEIINGSVNKCVCNSIQGRVGVNVRKRIGWRASLHVFDHLFDSVDDPIWYLVCIHIKEDVSKRTKP